VCISRVLGAVAAVGAAMAIVGLTTGSWATVTFYGSTFHGDPDRSRHMGLELFPDGRLTVHNGDASLGQQCA
jgi:hypothetical protein